MRWNDTSGKRFKQSVIASAEIGGGWSSEGYLALVDGSWAGVISVSRDSRYDDFADAARDDTTLELMFDWEGTPQELFRIAKLDTDLMFPDRLRNTEDRDYALISQLYKQILKWGKKRGKI